MSKHTGKAIQSGKMVTSGSKHTKRAKGRAAALNPQSRTGHTAKAMSRAGRPTKATVGEAAGHYTRRNTSGVPMTRG